VAEASVEVEVEADAVVGELDRGVVGPVVVPPEALHALIERTAVIPQLIHFPVAERSRSRRHPVCDVFVHLVLPRA
jgi:hypothetical protein